MRRGVHPTLAAGAWDWKVTDSGSAGDPRCQASPPPPVQLPTGIRPVAASLVSYASRLESKRRALIFLNASAVPKPRFRRSSDPNVSRFDSRFSRGTRHSGWRPRGRKTVATRPLPSTSTPGRQPARTAYSPPRSAEGGAATTPPISRGDVNALFGEVQADCGKRTSRPLARRRTRVDALRLNRISSLSGYGAAFCTNSRMICSTRGRSLLCGRRRSVRVRIREAARASSARVLTHTTGVPRQRRRRCHACSRGRASARRRGGSAAP
jgi:hypothetical protein